MVALATVLFPVSRHGPTRHDPANIIFKKDAIYPVVPEYRAAIRSKKEEKPVRSTFHDWIKVDSPAAQTLRSHGSHRWCGICLATRSPKDRVSLAQGLEMVVAIDTKTNRTTKELSVHDNHDKFGKLLADYKVTLRDAAEAKLMGCLLRHLWAGLEDGSDEKIFGLGIALGIREFAAEPPPLSMASRKRG